MIPMLEWLQMQLRASPDEVSPCSYAQYTSLQSRGKRANRRPLFLLVTRVLCARHRLLRELSAFVVVVFLSRGCRGCKQRLSTAHVVSFARRQGVGVRRRSASGGVGFHLQYIDTLC